MRRYHSVSLGNLNYHFLTGGDFLKRIIFMLLCLLLFSSSSLAMTVFEEESWIAAYFYDELNPTEKYYPFVDIRENNYYIDVPGNAVRTILSDYLLSQDFKVVEMLLSVGGFEDIR